jgi:cell division protease FtsH
VRDAAMLGRMPPTPQARQARSAGGGSGGTKQQPPRFQFPGWRLLLFVLALFAINFFVSRTFVNQEVHRVRVPYSPTFLEQVRGNNVVEITSKGTAIQGTFAKAVKYPPDAKKAKPTTHFKTEIPAFANTDQLAKELQSHGVTINAQPLETGPPWWESLLLGFGPTLLFLALGVWLLRRASSFGGGGGLMSFGRSRARRYEATDERVTFADVAGIDEAKAELTEVVDFLKSPEKYRRLGGRIPRGVLLSGPPGTGKTLLARAVAGEANEFVEAIVGIGASRVRDLFNQAKEAAPAIIFIDELDAIGRSRGSSLNLGGHDEREQTLNQILTEMDGFDSSTSVVVLAATNRPDVLDAALLRPGRFDRRVSVQPPDKNGRRKILEVHTRGVPLDPGVNLDSIASSTPGMVGADLANLVNEAALLAARRNHEKVQMEDFTDALERIVLGAERQIMLTEEDRARIAYHEAGHAIVGMLTPGADPVRKVSIIPRGMALGVTLASPTTDRFNYTEHYLRAKVKVALGGRVAEEIVFDSITTGAESDIRQLTEIARHMVGAWGMSGKVGPIAVLPQDGEVGPFGPLQSVSPETQELVDAEIRKLVDDLHAETTRVLTENRDKLDALANALLEHETLDEADAYAAAGVDRVPDRAPEPAPITAQ